MSSMSQNRNARDVMLSSLDSLKYWQRKLWAESEEL